MADQKETLLHWIDEDRDNLIDFLSRFIQAKSPNPPGDTREAAAYINRFLDENGQFFNGNVFSPANVE